MSKFGNPQQNLTKAAHEYKQAMVFSRNNHSSINKYDGNSIGKKVKSVKHNEFCIFDVQDSNQFFNIYY